MALGAMLPKVPPGNVDPLFCDTHAIHLPLGDQLHECRSGAAAIMRGGPDNPALGMSCSESPRTNPMLRPSGDQNAVRTRVLGAAGTTGRDDPPSAGAIDA